MSVRRRQVLLFFIWHVNNDRLGNKDMLIALANAGDTLPSRKQTTRTHTRCNVGEHFYISNIIAIMQDSKCL